MASTKYTYSILVDTANQAVETAKLATEIQSSSIVIALDYIDTNEDVLGIWMKDSLIQTEHTKLNTVVNSHDGVPVSEPDTVSISGNPMSTDGDLHVVNENFAHVSGNKGINWIIEKELENEETYTEIFVLPAGRHATINMMKGGSDQVPSTITLEWFQEISPAVFMRINPWIRGDEIIASKLVGNYTIGDTVLTVLNTNMEVASIRRDHYYCFYDTDLESGFHGKIIDKDVGAGTITLETGMPVDMADGMPFGLTDRVIGKVGNQIATDSLLWVSPPNNFYGNGKNYFKITITNEHQMKVGTITSVVNGWHTPTTGGD